MDYSYEPRKKTQQFKANIRRQQINHVFAQNRELLLLRYQEKSNKPLIDKLKQSFVEQKQFLNKRSLDLRGQPSLDWQSVIVELQASITAFNGQFEYWFTSSIIESLVRGLKSPASDAHLAPSICSLFSDMIYLGWNHDSNFCEKLMEYEFLQNVVMSGYDKRYSFRGRVHLFRFCGNISQYDQKYRNQFIRSGGGAWMVNLGQEIITNEISDDFSVVYYLLSVRCIVQYHEHSNACLPNLNIIYSMIPILADLLMKDQCSERAAVNCIGNMCQILRYNTVKIYQSVFRFNKLIHNMLQILNHDDCQVRFITLNFFSLLSFSDNVKIAEDLIAMGLLDRMNQAYCSRYIQQSQSKYGQVFINTVANLATNSKMLTTLIFEHPIFEIVFRELNHNETKNKSEAYYCLNSIVQGLNYPLYQQLLTKYQLFYHLISGIDKMMQIDGESLVEILNTILTIVKKSQEVFTAGGNDVINTLQRNFNFSQILETIINKCKNQMVRYYAEELHQKIAQPLWQGLNCV